MFLVTSSTHTKSGFWSLNAFFGSDMLAYGHFLKKPAGWGGGESSFVTIQQIGLGPWIMWFTCQHAFAALKTKNKNTTMKPSQGVSFLDQGLRYLRKITEQIKSPNSSAVRLNHPGNRGYLNSETGAILTFPVSKIIASSRYGGNIEMVDCFWIMRFPTPGLQKRPWKLFLTFNALKSFWANSLARHFLMLLLTGSVIVRDQLRMESLQNLSSIEPLQALLRFYNKINHLDVARFMNFCPVEKTNIYTSTPPLPHKISIDGFGSRSCRSGNVQVPDFAFREHVNFLVSTHKWMNCIFFMHFHQQKHDKQHWDSETLSPTMAGAMLMSWCHKSAPQWAIKNNKAPLVTANFL